VRRELAASVVLAAETAEVSRGERVAGDVPLGGLVRDVLQPDPQDAVAAVDLETARCRKTIG